MPVAGSGVPHSGLPSGDTHEGFGLHLEWERKLRRRKPVAKLLGTKTVAQLLVDDRE